MTPVELDIYETVKMCTVVLYSLLSLLTDVAVNSKLVEFNNNKTDCKTTHVGHEYNGSIAHTRNGTACLAWSDVNITAESNYCRNLDGRSRKPWCYTGIPIYNYANTTEYHGGYEGEYWDYCEIPLCSNHIECKKTRAGLNYRGTVSHTAEGRTCLPWSDKSIDEEKNYCRNIYEDELCPPWCYKYTYISGLSSSYCDIPYCNGVAVDRR